MLDDVGPVGVGRVDARVLERRGQEPPGRPDEGLALLVLLVAGLLAEKHQPGPLQPVAHHGLGRLTVELATAAVLDGLTELGKRATVRDPLLRPGSLLHHASRVPAQAVLASWLAGRRANGTRRPTPAAVSARLTTVATWAHPGASSAKKTGRPHSAESSREQITVHRPPPC